MADVNRLLALANGAALHKALTDRKAGVSYRTVARWIGEDPKSRPSPPMVPLILDAFGLSAQQETAPAWWAEAANALVAQIEERMMPTTGELAVPDELVRRIAHDLAGELGLSAPLDDEAPAAESVEPQGAANKAAKRPR